jgi:hypothetical protein
VGHQGQGSVQPGAQPPGHGPHQLARG